MRQEDTLETKIGMTIACLICMCILVCIFACAGDGPETRRRKRKRCEDCGDWPKCRDCGYRPSCEC